MVETQVLRWLRTNNMVFLFLILIYIELLNITVVKRP